MKNTCGKSIITKEYVHNVVRKREADIHKGDCGKVLIVAGTKGMAGAAVLAGTGAYRAGSGLVRIAIDEELFPIVQIGLKEATCVARTNLPGDLSYFDAIGIGPGLGDDVKNVDILKTILDNYKKTVVIDADGLNLIAKAYAEEGEDAALIRSIKATEADIIMTPHEGEAMRLLGITKEMFKELGREKAAENIAGRFGTVAVLKGHETIVATPDGESYINTTGNAGMATGGSGDVLTGIITSLAGQGLCALDAAKAGVFIHGLAGDIGASKLSQHGLMAGDIADFTALAIREIVGQ